MAETSPVFGASPDKKGQPQGAGDRVLRVISHPIRIEILRVLSSRVASPKELARELGESVSNVSYHFKYLRLEGCIEIVETEQRRGAIEHYYRAKQAPLDGDEAWTGLSLTAIELDEQGWRELVERQAEWMKEAERIGGEAAKRIASEGGTRKRVVAGAMGFETSVRPAAARLTT